MNIYTLTLSYILTNPTESLTSWAKLKSSFFSGVYSSMFVAINRYYTRYSELPTFDNLEIFASRNKSVINEIEALKKVEIPDNVSITALVEAVTDKYTQEQALTSLSKYVDNVSQFSPEEVKLELENIVLDLEQKTHDSEVITLMSDIRVIDEAEVNERVKLKLNDTMDVNGINQSELVLIGGQKGTGKSVVCSNIAVNQYTQGNIGLYFSIEMRAREVFTRCLSILSGVNHSRIRNSELTQHDKRLLAEARRAMFEDAEDISFEGDLVAFEDELVRKRLKKNQIVIVDNQSLSLADIDLNIMKCKAQYGDKLKVVVVDYINAIMIDDNYSWISQLELSAGLKNLARKHNVTVVAPYQIDDNKQARFSKAILDKADIAAVLEAQNGRPYINFTSTKTRNTMPFEFNAPIDWNTLKMEPTEAVVDNDNDNDEDI